MGRLVFVFPGQGSQGTGMGRAIATAHDSAAAVYDRAREVLGWDVAALSFDGPDEELAGTENAQVVLFVNSMAVKAVLDEKGVAADAVTGHSLGEYSALAAAGAIGFDEGLELVAARGEAMRDAAAAHPGAMAAVLGLEDAAVEKICSDAGDVWPVNYNSPGQLVISGEESAVARAEAEATAVGARKVVRLPVSGGFHSPLMAEAAAAMREKLASAGFRDPVPPFFSPISCRYETAAGLADLLERQIVSPVRWHEAVTALIAAGADRFLEVGNGKVLSGLIRRIDKSVATANAPDPDSLEKAIGSLVG